MKLKLPELLAPAGTPDAAWAALTYGAEAVYVGLPRFSARAEADNFSTEALDELIGYAHSLDRRVYITLNTLIQENELGAALSTLAQISELNVDAVIVQDLGIARLIRKNFPQLRLHASTQLAVHNLDGAQQLAEIGFSRVVLARELSLDAIEHITQNCGIETEAFIHGALCYSYSGLCLLSSHQLGRSGNRGRCAYSCRQAFRADGKETLPFSMMDFSAAAHMNALLATGVSSLKIEGRMKSPIYVAAVTDFYRQLVDGKINASRRDQTLSDIQTIFGRPSTELYLKDPETQPVDPVNDGNHGAFIGTVSGFAGSWMILETNRALQKRDGLKVEAKGTHAFGFAADEMRLKTDSEKKRRFDIPANSTVMINTPDNSPFFEIGTRVYCSYSQAVRQRYDFTAPRPGVFRQRRDVNVQIDASIGKIRLIASAGPVRAEHILPGPFELAKKPEKSAEAIRRSFEKLGDTDWKLNELTISKNSVAVFAPASVLNEARRQVIEELTVEWNSADHGTKLSATLTEDERAVFADSHEPIEPIWSVKSKRVELLEPLREVDEFVLEIDPARAEEIERALEIIPAEKLRLALPVIINESDADAFRELIASLPEHQKWEAANVGGLHLLKGKTDLTADWSLYTLNTQAALHWKEQGINQFVLSPEDDAQNYCALVGQLGSSAILPIYQHTPLMISATAPVTASNTITDRSQRTFQIEKCGTQSVISNTDPFALVDQLDELQSLGARQFRIDLCYGIESADQAAEIVKDIRAGQPVEGHAGNFNRALK